MNFLVPDFHLIRLPLLLLCVPLLLVSIQLLTGQFPNSERRPEAGSTREKRRAPRNKSDAVFDLDDEAGHYSPGNAQLIDMSVWGACISSTVLLQKDQSIRGRIHSPTEGLLQIAGQVVWARKRTHDYLYGIAFTKITRETHQ